MAAQHQGTLPLRMRRCLPLLSLLLCLAGAARAEPCPPAPAQMLALPALAAGQPWRIVAFGSSSTEGAGASGPAAGYPAVLERLLRAALPGREVTVRNLGHGGDTAAEMLARLDAVLAERPALVIWQAGTNDALRGRDPARFRAELAAGLARLREAGAAVVLLDSQRAPQVLASPGHAAFDAALAGAGVPLFSRAALMRAWAAAGTPPEAMLVADGLHHNDRGYACLAAALAESLLAAVRR